MEDATLTGLDIGVKRCLQLGNTAAPLLEQQETPNVQEHVSRDAIVRQTHNQAVREEVED